MSSLNPYCCKYLKLFSPGFQGVLFPLAKMDEPISRGEMAQLLLDYYNTLG